jgi:hypothetical protein
MATNDFLPWATGGGANVEAQATYVSDPVVGTGETTGTANSARCNKAWRQATQAAYLLGQLIVDFTGLNATDDGNVATLLANLKQALVNMMWTTGDVKFTFLAAAPSGWVLITDGTIGSAGSGATYANANASALYTVIWTNVSNTWAPVTGGRGGSAGADFAANKPMALPKSLGRAIAIAGAGSGLTSRVLGQFLGEEAHILTPSEAPTLQAAAFTSAGPSPAGLNAYSGNAPSAHNTMPPTTFLNMLIKL